jgi:hypothetical protein
MKLVSVIFDIVLDSLIAICDMPLAADAVSVIFSHALAAEVKTIFLKFFAAHQINGQRQVLSLGWIGFFEDDAR